MYIPLICVPLSLILILPVLHLRLRWSIPSLNSLGLGWRRTMHWVQGKGAEPPDPSIPHGVWLSGKPDDPWSSRDRGPPWIASFTATPVPSLPVPPGGAGGSGPS